MTIVLILYYVFAVIYIGGALAYNTKLVRRITPSLFPLLDSWNLGVLEAQIELFKTGLMILATAVLMQIGNPVGYLIAFLLSGIEVILGLTFYDAKLHQTWNANLHIIVHSLVMIFIGLSLLK